MVVRCAVSDITSSVNAFPALFASHINIEYKHDLEQWPNIMVLGCITKLLHVMSVYKYDLALAVKKIISL